MKNIPNQNKEQPAAERISLSFVLFVWVRIGGRFNLNKMDKKIADKVKQCKALQGKSVVDVMDMRNFQDNLAAYWTQQVQSRKQVENYCRLIAKPVPAHPIAKLKNLSVSQLMMEYLAAINGTSVRTSSERLYIKQLCQQAYNLTVAQIVCKQYPELESELLPKAKAN